MKKERIKWIDAARGWCFFWVVYSHLEFCNQDLMKFFTPIFLTGFFFVSGYLFKSGQTFKVVFEQRLRTIIIPCIIYGTFLLLCREFFTFKTNTIPFKDAFLNFLLQNKNNAGFMWFLPSLFIYSLFFYFVDKFCNSKKLLLKASLSLFFLNFLLVDFLPHNYRLHHIGYACAYMSFGKWFKLSEVEISRFLFKKTVIICLLPVYFVLVLIFDKISYYGSKYCLDAMLLTVIGIILLVYVSKIFIEKSKLFLFVGFNSLSYFMIHGKIYAVLEFLVHKVFPSYLQFNMATTTFLSLLITLLTLLLLIIPVKFISEFLSFSLGKGYKLFL